MKEVRPPSFIYGHYLKHLRRCLDLAERGGVRNYCNFEFSSWLTMWSNPRSAPYWLKSKAIDPPIAVQRGEAES